MHQAPCRKRVDLYGRNGFEAVSIRKRFNIGCDRDAEHSYFDFADIGNLITGLNFDQGRRELPGRRRICETLHDPRNIDVVQRDYAGAGIDIG